jgi:hypothetical protein
MASSTLKAWLWQWLKWVFVFVCFVSGFLASSGGSRVAGGVAVVGFFGSWVCWFMALRARRRANMAVPPKGLLG